LSSTITLILPSNFQSVERVVDESESFFGQFYDDEELLYKLQLLASEAITNGVEHGNEYDESKTVTVIFEADPDVATISVEDQGNGFDRSSVENPLSESHILDDGGRGLFLMEAMADEVKYDLDGRRVTIRVNHPSGG